MTLDDKSLEIINAYRSITDNQTLSMSDYLHVRQQAISELEHGFSCVGNTAIAEHISPVQSTKTTKKIENKEADKKRIEEKQVVSFSASENIVSMQATENGKAASEMDILNSIADAWND